MEGVVVGTGLTVDSVVATQVSCPSLLQHCSRLQCRAAVYPAWHFILLHRGPALVRCPCIRNGLLPFQHDGLWSRASHARRELVRAVGLHPLPKWSHCTEAVSKIIGQMNGVWPPACVISSSGRTSWPGDPRPNPQGAGADRPYLSLSIKEKCHQQHPTA